MARKILSCLLMGFASVSITMLTACCEQQEPQEDGPANGDDNSNNVEVCNDREDNDGDGSTDCDDLDCLTSEICRNPPAVEICGDRVDNDGDGRTDCSDSDCFNDAACNFDDGACTPTSCGPGAICEDGVCVDDGQPSPIEPCRNVGQECEAGSDTDNMVCAAGNTLDNTDTTCHSRCDPERVDEDCPRGALCVGQGNEGFCLRSNCTSPVLSEEECGSIGPNGGQCLIARNDSFVCIEAGTIAAGEACPEPTEADPQPSIRCQGGLICYNGICEAYCNAGDDASCGEDKACLPTLDTDEFGVCAVDCPGFEATDECGEGMGCVPVSTDQGFCDEVGEVPLGEACDEENLCGPLTTCQRLDEENPLLCRAYCDRTEGNGDETCNTGEICLEVNDNLGACLPGCTPFVEETGCEEEGQLNCIPLHEDRGLCLDSGAVAGGEACDGSAESMLGECAEGFACNPERDEQGRPTSDGTCAAICRTFSSIGGYDSGCAENQICAFIGTHWGICQDLESEPLNVGDACTPTETTWCNHDSLCVQIDQEGNGQCIALCRTENGNDDCPETQTCTNNFFDGDDVGLCVP